MQGDKTVLEHLNRGLRTELTATNQFFLHARLFRNWGLPGLGRREYRASIEAMRHADRLIVRILFLEGRPNPRRLGRLQTGTEVRDCIAGDLALDTEGRSHYVEAIHWCESARDYVTRDILEDLLHAAEGRIDHLETQLALIDAMGLANYLERAVEEDGG